MNKHRLILKLLFLLIFFVAVANSFFAEAFTSIVFLNFSVAQLTNGFFLIIFLFYNFFNSDREFWNYLVPLLLLSLFSLISTIWSPYPFVASVFSLKLLFIVNVFVLTANLITRDILKENQVLFLAKGVVLITIVGQTFGLLLGVNVYNNEFSSAGLSDNSSVVSAQLLFALPVIFMGNFKRKTDFFYVFLILFSIIFTLRRSALISVLLVLMVILIANLFSLSNTQRQKLNWVLLSTAIVFSFFWILNHFEVGNALISRLIDLNPARGGSASGRYDFQYLGVRYILTQDFFPMLLGEGFGFSIAVNVKNGFTPIGMHSDLIDIFIGLGFVGIIFYLWFIYRIWMVITKFHLGSANSNALLSFFIAIVSISIFTGGFFEMNTMLGYMTFALVYAKVHA
jgi:hypothetical protein